MTHNLFVEPWFYAAVAAVITAFRLLRSRVKPQWLLLPVNAGFLGVFAGARVWLPLLALYAVVVPALAVWMRAGGAQKAARLLVAIALSLAVLVVFRYPSFVAFSKTLTALSSWEWLGLSYLTFRAIDLLMAASRAKTAPDPWVAAAYLTFFAPYVSGPINRFAAFTRDVTGASKPLGFDRIRRNLIRASAGVLKLLLLSRLAFYASIVAPGYTTPHTLGELTLGLYAYLFYIYFDFSGYCDVAIAVADFFDVGLPENFRWPMFAPNLQDFWNRWHISLSHFCRDYVFFPLLKKISPGGALYASAFAILATFSVIGLWHGDSLHWVSYGLLHGAGLAWVMFYRQGGEWALGERFEWLQDAWLYRAGATVLTFNFVAVSLLLTIDFPRAAALLALR